MDVLLPLHFFLYSSLPVSKSKLMNLESKWYLRYEGINHTFKSESIFKM